MYKACSRCGKIHPVGQECKKIYNTKYDDESKLRNKSVWQKKRKEIRDNAKHLCEVCLDNNIINYDKIEIHHIDKLRDRKELFLENNNLICLCSTCHKLADDGKISKQYLRRLASRREE